MTFQSPKTIKSVISEIDKRQYLLPAIQREFIWKPNQIIGLFDSLMQDYPIGSFLLWMVEKETANKFQFYEILRDYHERDNTHNPKVDLSGDDGTTAILDGQQRLTALHIGLKSSYAGKLPYMHYNNPLAFPKKKLYLNLLAHAKNSDNLYDFRFLTEDEAQEKNPDYWWFKVGKILDFELKDVVNYESPNWMPTLDESKVQFSKDTLLNLFDVITRKLIINYYLETDQLIEKVLNIFIRVNKMGTPLSYSDLLLSFATAEWKNRDAKEVITKFVDEINRNGFRFNKDFVLKSCLVLNDSDVRFKVSSFNKLTMPEIERKWVNFSNSIQLSIKLISSFGYNAETLPSTNAVIPIAYYLMQNGLQESFIDSTHTIENRKKIHQWFVASLLKRTFSSAADTALSQIREVLSENKGDFPLEKLIERFRGDTKSIIFSNDDLDNLLTYQYGQSYTFSTLAILYPHLDFSNLFHIDHIFPRSKFTQNQLKKFGVEETKIKSFIDKVDTLGNLQLIKGRPNLEKSDKMPREWIEATYPYPLE
ncbi:MAG: DUF262 domain-containing protein, partial [Methanomicrobiales archaeon]